MSKIDVDTDKLRNCGNNIKFLSKNLEKQLDGLFEKLIKINEYGWVGKSANEYMVIINNEKIKLINFVAKILDEGQVIVDSSSMLEKNLKTVKERYK